MARGHAAPQAAEGPLGSLDAACGQLVAIQWSGSRARVCRRDCADCPDQDDRVSEVGVPRSGRAAGSEDTPEARCSARQSRGRFDRSIEFCGDRGVGTRLLAEGSEPERQAY